MISCLVDADEHYDVLDKIKAMNAQIPLYAYRNYLVYFDDTFDSKYRHSPVAVCDVSYPIHRSSQSLFIDNDWRKRICEWMYKVRSDVSV